MLWYLIYLKPKRSFHNDNFCFSYFTFNSSSQIKQSKRRIETLLHLKYYSRRTRSIVSHLRLKADNNHKTYLFNAKSGNFFYHERTHSS